jgi:UDP-N-acetylmuramoylalanine--D-glutamate ligase
METAHTFKPYIGAVLNITPDHLDRHYTMEAYALLKEKIFFNQTPDDFAVLNYDDPYCLAMKPLGNVVFFSKKAELAQGVFLDNGRIRAKLGDIGGPSDVYLCDINQIKGLPENALAATAMCLCAGAPAEAVTRTLMTFPGVEHRIEYVAEINGVTYYNDSKATNTDAAIKALEAMRGPVVLIGGGYDKHADYGDWVNAFAKGKVKHLLLIGQTAEAIASECHAQGYNYFDYADTLGDAVTAAAALAKPGDCVLLSPACASWGMFNNYEERGRLFKQYVRALETEQA